MKFFPNFATIVSVGNFELRWYPVLLTLGGLSVYFITWHNLKKEGYKEDVADDLFIGCTIGGVIGARLWYCIFYDFEYYFSNPINLIKTWEGGLAIQGAIAGGVIYVIFYCKKHRYSLMRVLDCIFAGVLLGQAIGRWGNFFNQEAFGRIVEESFYNGWPAFIKDHMFIGGNYQEPTFLYESALNLLGFLLINFVYKKYSKPKRGDVVYAYLMWYGVDRFIVESFRSDSLMLGNIKMAQLTAIFFAIVGVIGMLGVFRRFETKPVVLFDYDQTLAQTGPTIWATFKTLFEKYLPDHPFGEEERKYVLGPTLQQSFTHFEFSQDVEELVKEYRIINKEMQKDVKESPNTTMVLKELKKRGYKVGIVTSKIKDSVDASLEHMEFQDCIDVLIDITMVENSKPDPEGILKAVDELKGSYDSLIYVGDAASDVKGGLNARAYAIGYNIDPSNNEVLKKAGALAVINDMQDILEILKEDHSWTSTLN